MADREPGAEALIAAREFMQRMHQYYFAGEPKDRHLPTNCGLCIGTPMLALALEEYAEEEREECAKLLEARADEVLSKQTGRLTEMDISVDMNLRMMALLLPEQAEAIRARGGRDR